MDPPISVLVALLAVALIGALAGSAGFAAFFVARQNRRIADLAERLTKATGDAELIGVDAKGIEDPRVRDALHDLAEKVAATWQQATIDPLTGVANRQAILARIDSELARASRYHHSLSLVMVDLDHFKRLNDSYGHESGDVVLRQVAQQLATSVRAVDAAGRYGGEEFLLVLPETDVDAAAALAEKLRRLVGASQVELPTGDRVSVTLSAGVAGGPGPLLSLDALVRDADAAMYSAKALGRDQVYVFRETGDMDTVRRAPITAEARTRAMEVGRAAMSAAQDELMSSLAERASWAGKPSTLIAEASLAMARSIGLPDGELARIRTASLLHDLGKLAVPDEILSKPGELAEPEWRIVAEHPKIGQVVLEQAGALRDAATIVLHHHEWYDGRGYPHGLHGDEIPIGARIVAIADAYEAMIAGRPYRAAVGHGAAVTELRRHAGVQFDPDLVEVFATLFAGGVPWEPDEHHAAPPQEIGPLGRVDRRTTGQIHDAVHARRRRAG